MSTKIADYVKEHIRATTGQRADVIPISSEKKEMNGVTRVIQVYKGKRKQYVFYGLFESVIGTGLLAFVVDNEKNVTILESLRGSDKYNKRVEDLAKAVARVYLKA